MEFSIVTSGPRASVHWQTAEARFHFWLAANGEPQAPIYKNPLGGPYLDAGTPDYRRNPDYFSTRVLRTDTAASRKIMAEAIAWLKSGPRVEDARRAADAAQVAALAAERALLAVKVRNALLCECQSLEVDGKVGLAADIRASAWQLTDDQLLRLRSIILSA